RKVIIVVAFFGPAAIRALGRRCSRFPRRGEPRNPAGHDHERPPDRFRCHSASYALWEDDTASALRTGRLSFMPSLRFSFFSLALGFVVACGDANETGVSGGTGSAGSTAGSGGAGTTTSSASSGAASASTSSASASNTGGSTASSSTAGSGGTADQVA